MPISLSSLTQAGVKRSKEKTDCYLQCGACQHRYRSGVNILAGEEGFSNMTKAGCQKLMNKKGSTRQIPLSGDMLLIMRTFLSFGLLNAVL